MKNDTRIEEQIKIASEKIRNAKEIIKTVDPSILTRCQKKLNWLCEERRILIYAMKTQKNIEEHIFDSKSVIFLLVSCYAYFKDTLSEENKTRFLETEKKTVSTPTRKALMEAYNLFSYDYDFDDIEEFYKGSIYWLICIVNYLLEISAIMHGFRNRTVFLVDAS